MITVNNTKATEITKEAIRAYRKPLLESAIVASKQTLRDMTATANGKSVDELKAIVEGLA